MKKLLPFLLILSLGIGQEAFAQAPKNVQTSQVAATRGHITENLSFGTGKTGSFLSGSTLSVAGTLSGTPTGGTLNLSALTLTLPATFLTAAQLAAVNASGVNTDGLVEWSQLVGVPAGFADGSDDGSGGGSGTVTTFSAGDLSPLFTTSEATATTTPALTFSLSNAAQNTVFAGPATGGTGAPSYRALVLADLPALTSAEFAGKISDETGTGASVLNTDPVILAPNSAMGALAVDVTKKRNTKTISADSTLTFSATPTAGTIFGLRLTNSDSAVHTITIPSSFSYWRGTITSFVIPASSTVELSWDYDGTTYYIAGDPVTFNDLTTATPVAGDLVPFYDVSGGVDGKATIANLISPQIGVTVQAYDADLTTYASITPSANVQSLLGAANYAAMRALLDLEAGTDFLAYPSGTPTGSKFLRDDNTWQTVSGSSAPTVNAQTGTTYTLVLGDANNIVTMSNASANTLTIPPNSSVAFANGTIIQVQQGGAGATTFDPGSGVTMNGATSNVTLSEQYEWATLVKLGTDAWALSYMAGPGTGSVTSVAASVPGFLSVSGSPITTSGTLAISYSGTALPVANGGTGITSFGTGVAAALGTNTNGAGGFTTTDGTKTLTNTTLDASATGNVLKAKSYIYLTHPHLADGTNATIGTTATSIAYGHATFSNSVDEASNYVEYYLQVPEDIDTSVALRARIKVLLGNTDTSTQRYVLSSVSVADSAVPTASTLANSINIDFAGDGSGANGDVETSAWTTLTSWAGALTAGQTWRIRLARDGNATEDASTVNSTELGLVIEYGITQ